MKKKQFQKQICKTLGLLGAMICFAIVSDNLFGQGNNTPTRNPGYRDIYSDTWVASDALGRKMPSLAEVGSVKNDKHRVVGIFYVAWHTQDQGKGEGNYAADVNKILKIAPEARLDAKHPIWKYPSYHWGEPEMDYFLSQDEWVIRKDISMLADAGVDVLIMDVTNGVSYWDEWEVVFKTMQKMKEEGNKVPKFCFWNYANPIPTVHDLYERIYKKRKYEDLWFYWDGKPLLLYNGKPQFDHNTGKNTVTYPNPRFNSSESTDPNNSHFNDPMFKIEIFKDYVPEVKEFFTLRTMWWGYFEWAGERFVGTEDVWSFGYNLADPNVKSMNPKDLVSRHQGRFEQAAVTPAQHAVSLNPVDHMMGVGKSWSRVTGQPKLNEYDLCGPTYVPWLGKTVENPEGYGIYFQERWDEALDADPEFVCINDWNEWTAGKYQPPDGGTYPYLGRANPFYFVDQYNSEFNRCVQPMKGGYTDNYYMQMSQNIRKYKGVRPIPELKGYTAIPMRRLKGWEQVTVEYRDTKGDVFHRGALGYGGIKYVNESGRNDIVTSKVAIDKDHIYFFAETAGLLTPHTGNNWMLLMIDADNNSKTGWYGFDYIINKDVKDEKTTKLLRYDASNVGNPWVFVTDLKMNYAANKLEIAVPRSLLGLNKNQFIFDFKWSDNTKDLIDPISFCLNGDTAPNRRFNYRCIWKK